MKTVKSSVNVPRTAIRVAKRIKSKAATHFLINQFLKYSGLVNRVIILLSVYMLGVITPVLAQQTLIAAGGEFTSAKGTVSFSIGQVDFITQENSVTVITEGAQQPYMSRKKIPTEKKFVSLRLYPNPVTTSLNIVVKSDENTDYLFTIYNISGQAMKSKKVSCIKNAGFLTWDVKDLTHGTYILRAIGKNIEAIPFIKL